MEDRYDRVGYAEVERMTKEEVAGMNERYPTLGEIAKLAVAVIAQSVANRVYREILERGVR